MSKNRIKLSSGEVTLSNGVKLNIGVEFDSPKDLSRSIIKATYEHYIGNGHNSISEARMETAIALGYAESSIRRVLVP